MNKLYRLYFYLRYWVDQAAKKFLEFFSDVVPEMDAEMHVNEASEMTPHNLYIYHNQTANILSYESSFLNVPAEDTELEWDPSLTTAYGDSLQFLLYGDYRWTPVVEESTASILRGNNRIFGRYLASLSAPEEAQIEKFDYIIEYSRSAMTAPEESPMSGNNRVFGRYHAALTSPEELEIENFISDLSCLFDVGMTAKLNDSPSE